MLNLSGLTFQGFSGNLSAISTIELAKEIRKSLGLTLSQSLQTASIIKEAYRVGEIRGRSLK